jgi:CBS domain containing-hemolysin-like protein
VLLPTPEGPSIAIAGIMQPPRLNLESFTYSSILRVELQLIFTLISAILTITEHKNRAQNDFLRGDFFLDEPGPLLYLAIAILVSLSAFFALCETAISTVNKLRLRKAAAEGDKNAAKALKLAEDYNRTLFTIIIGNNIVNIATASIATVVATAIWGPAGAVISTVAVTILVLVFGEIIPKSHAGQYSERMALSAAGPLRFFVVLLTPFTWIFTRLLPKTGTENAMPTVTEDELIYMLESIEEQGVIEEQERDLVQSALEFDEVTIREILTPRVDIAALDASATPEEVKALLISERYSRIPVYENSIDDIVGILITRDYLRRVAAGETPELRAMLTPPIFVHRTMKLSQLLAKLRMENNHMAVVSDDYGGTLGIVTMEDLLEELVGEIWDEGDDVPHRMVRVGVSAWEAEGSLDADDMFEKLGADKGEYEIPDGDYNTVNGWAGHIYGHIPQVGETAVYKDLELTVLQMEGRRIQYLRIQRVQNV